MIPDSSAGGLPELRAFVGSILQHIMGLISLASWEGRAASARYFRLIIALLSTIFFLLVGYLLLLSFCVLFLHQWLKIEWMWIALALAGIHGAIALVGIWAVTRNLGKPLFAATLSEIRRDIETFRPPNP